MSRNRRSRGANNNRGRNRQSAGHSQSRNDDGADDGWVQSRAEKRNKIKNTKSGNRSNGGKPKMNRNRNRGRKSKAKPSVDDIVDLMTQDTESFSQFRRDELHAVVVHMALKTYHPNDQQTRIRIFNELENRAQESISLMDHDDDHKLNGHDHDHGASPTTMDKDEESEYTEDEEDDDDDENSQSESGSASEYDEESSSQTPSQSPSDSASHQYNDHNDHSDQSDDDMDHDDDHDIDDGDEEQFDDDGKEQSQSPAPQDPEPSEVDDKQSVSPPHDEPQRTKKKKRRRKKKKKNRGDDNAPDQPATSISPDNDGNNGRDGRDVVVEAPKNARKRVRKKQKSLGDNLRDLNLVDPATSTMVNSWVTSLRCNNQFMSSFQSAKGMDYIVKSVVLQFCDLDSLREETQKLKSIMVELFDIMLCGTNEYHHWLLDQLINLSHQISKQSANAGSNLVSIISQQAESLVHAQCNLVNNSNEIVVNRDNFEKPSQLLHDGHRKRSSDPIISVLEKLDPELEILSNLYHDLKEHDSRIRQSCPTQSEAFRSDYNEIKQTLTQNISTNANMQREKEDELEGMRQQEQRLETDQEAQKQPFERELDRFHHDKRRLQSDKMRIEEQLREIDENLAKTELRIDNMENELASIAETFKPRMDDLERGMTDSQFELAKYSRETECYSALLNTVEQSYRRLDDWSNMQLDSTSSDRCGKEKDYIDHFVTYVKRMCDAKAKVIQRLQHIKETKKYYRESNDRAQKHYSQSLNMDPHIEHCEQLIVSDEEMNRNMERAIFAAIDKAQKMVSPRLFDRFIQQISNDVAGKYINLSRYKPQRQMNKVQQVRGGMPRSTQTNVNRQSNNMQHRHPPQRAAVPRARVQPQHTQPMAQRPPLHVQGQSQVQGQRAPPHGQGQQHQRLPQQQQQHTAPHRQQPPRQRQPLPQRQPLRQTPPQTMNGAVNQNRQNVNVHTAPSAMTMGGRKPPMKSSQNGQSQQMMQHMMNNGVVNGAPHHRTSGASKPPVISSGARGHNDHYNQQPQQQNVESSQQVQGQQQQQPPQQQQVQRRRAPVGNGQGNEVNNMQHQYQQQYRQ